MSPTLSSLNEALTDNASTMEALLQQQQYDEALQCMDERLALIASLEQLARDDPSQQPEIASLAATLATQEACMTALATSHHQTIFKQLTQVGRANKAGRAYRVNSKEF